MSSSSILVGTLDTANPLSNLPQQTTSSVTLSTIEAGAVASSSNPPICRYFKRGICRFRSQCRYSHELPENGDKTDLNTATPIASSSSSNRKNSTIVSQHLQPSTSRKNWIDAPVFVPRIQKQCNDPSNDDQLQHHLSNYNNSNISDSETTMKTWSDVVGGGNKLMQDTQIEVMCPFESPCPYGVYCRYSLHFELCKMCDQYCLHPTDLGQRRTHNRECLQQHEQAMELSFAIARSKDKTCGICFETVMEKTGREKRFGILPNCCHIFCLECIRKWRQAKQFEHKITRSCPECRTSSDFVCPSAFWVDTKEEKDKLLTGYRSALGAKDCKYFQKGAGECPFGNKCFYKHALPNGDIVDVGCPKRARKIQHGANDIMDLLDIYLWEFFEQRELGWLDLASSIEDNSDDSDDSDDYN